MNPPFDLSGAQARVRFAEDAWNTRDPHRVANGYTEDTVWRNRDTFIEGREAVVQFLAHKWEKEQDYRLAKQLWCFGDDRIGVRFQYEYHNENGQWFRAYGNELWEFRSDGKMKRREASINDLAISESERRFRWNASGPRNVEDGDIDGFNRP